MDTRHLRSFLKIADLRSITRAAESLGIAQPSLSQQLLRLEDEVGFKLFRRTARGVIVTEAGRIFEEHARQILRGTDQALEDVRHLKDAASGQVVFAMPYSLSRLLGVPLFEAMLEHAPHVSIRLVEAMTGHIRGWLDQSKIDLGILYDLGPLRHLSARRLASEELVLVGPTGEFGDAAHPGEVTAQDLARYPLILPGPANGHRHLLDREAARLGVALDVAHDIDAIGHIGALVAAGHGYSILPRGAVASELLQGQVSVASIGGGTLRRTLCLVRNSSQVVTQASVLVEDLTIKILAQLIARGEWIAELDAPWRDNQSPGP